MKPRSFANKALGRTSLLATLVFTGFAAQSAWAANITMTSSNGVGTSGFNSGTGWPSGIAPTGGNNYFTGAFTLRTPADGTSRSFAGDSLSVDAGGRFISKNTGSTATITVNNLILNGGYTDIAVSNADSLSVTLAGAITVNANSSMGALGGAANNSGSSETLNVTATIGGSAGLTIAGSIPNGGSDTGVVRFSAANTYSGTLTVATPSTGFVASATNRLLQLNHLNALQNATLNLTSVANGVSFTSAANTGTFNVGALSGSSNQALTDTVANPVALNVGSNNATTSYTGVLSGTGSLIKSGSGTLTLTNTNTYFGNTTVNAGTLSISSAYLSNTSVVSIASGAFLNLTHGATDVVAGLVLGGVTQADGVYGAISSGAQFETSAITGGGFIQVTTPTPQNISLIASDAVNTNSFNSGLHWSDATPPFWMNHYFTGAFDLRTSTSAANFTFAGASLSVDAGGRFIGKGAAGTTTQNVTVNNLILNGGLLFQAQGTADTAVLNLSGAINVTAASPIGSLGGTANDSAGFETLNIQSTISGSAALTVAGSSNGGVNTGVVKLSAANPYSGNITVLQPGSGFIASTTNRLLQLNNLNALANATLTLGTTAANGVSFASGANTGAFNIGALAGTANQALTDTAGGNVTLNVGGTGGSASYSGALSGGGALIKSGSGIQTLSGANAYTGTTSVNNGTLVLSGSSQSIGSLTVADGAGVTFKTAAADSTVATTTGLTLGTSGPTDLVFDFNGFNTTAPFISTGGFTANGTVNVAFATVGFLTNGIHPLINYTSFSGTSPSGSIAIGSRGTGTLINDTTNNVLKLEVTGVDAPKWTGADDGNWVLGATGANNNWKLVAASTGTDYVEFDSVLFDDSAIGTHNIDISAADVTPVSVTFDTTAGYTLGGAFGIAGSTPLVKSGPGTLIITNTNTYTGATNILGGVLQVGNGGLTGSLGTGAIFVDFGTTLGFDRDGTAVVGNAISGSGTILNSGPGTVAFTANSTGFTGDVSITGGTLQFGDGGANGSLGTVPIDIAAGATFAIKLSDTPTIANPLSGDGSLTITGGGPIVSGYNVHTGGVTVTDGGTLRAPADTVLGDFPVAPIVNSIRLIQGGMKNQDSDTSTDPYRGITITGEAYFTAGWSKTLTLNGPITGTGNVFINYDSGKVIFTDPTSDWNGVLTLGASMPGFTGTTGGNLEIQTITNGGVAGPLGVASADPGNLVFNGGRLVYNGADASSDRGFTLQSSGTIEVVNSILTMSGLATGPGSLTKIGDGTLVLSGANDFDGSVRVDDGVLAITHSSALGSTGKTLDIFGDAANSRIPEVRLGGGLSLTVSNLTTSGAGVDNLTGALRNISGDNTLTVTTQVTMVVGNGSTTLYSDAGTLTINSPLFTANAANRTLTLAGPGNGVINAPITNGATANLPVVKAGSGTWTLNGAHTYTGATTVNGGVLSLSQAALDDAAAVTIAADAVLDLNFTGIDRVGSLTINGVAKGNGVYTAATDPGFITGTGSIRVGPEGYSSWASNYPFTVGVNDGPNDDPDGDGINNLLEYVLGGIPIGTGSSDTSILPSQTLNATDLVLTFHRSDLSESDVVLKVQWSDDMTTWHDFATIGAVDALPAVDVTEDSPTADIDTVIVTIPRSTTPGGKLFARVQAVK